MDYQQAARLLAERDNILLLTHKRPDGDTLGSAAALCLALRAMGKEAWLLTNPQVTGLFTGYLEGLCREDFEPEFVVSVDVASLGLLPDNAAPYAGRIDLALDHHPSNEGFGGENCVDPSRAACGELVYDLIGCLTPLTAEMAMDLYVAVSTDTGCFQYSNTTWRTHAVAAELLKFDFPCAQVNKRHFRTKSLKRLKLEGELLGGMKLYQSGTLAMAALTLDIMERVEAREEDAEDISAFLGQIEGIRHAATFRELSPGEFKLSLRTDEHSLNASAVCALLGGGGHAAAAGATLTGTLEEVYAQLLAAVEQVQGKA